MAYSIILENTVTKSTIAQNVVDISTNNGIWEFNLNTLNLDDGEYTLTLVEYEDGLEITDEELFNLLDGDNIPIFIKNKDKDILNDEQALINGSKNKINILYSDILRVGEYTNAEEKTYKNKREIKQYNG